MPSEIALFGPIASGKSTLLDRAKKESPNCTSVETDDITLDKSEQIILAKALLALIYGEALVMTAGKLDAADLQRWG